MELILQAISAQCCFKHGPFALLVAIMLRLNPCHSFCTEAPGSSVLQCICVILTVVFGDGFRFLALYACHLVKLNLAQEREKTLQIINHRRIVAGFKLLFGLHPPGRNVAVRPEDTFLVSYPKSGNTWARFLVANLAYPETPATFANINNLVPDPEALSKRRMSQVPSPRILKSHESFHPRYRRIIYVVRDPRDVALSQFHFHRKRKVIADDYPIDKFVKRFLGGETSPYGSWGEHVGSWVATRYGQADFLLLRYEDMVSQIERELARVASFLKIDAQPERISQAVARSSADQMRQLEKAAAHVWSTTKETRQDIAFVRTAKSGGWRSGLPAASVREIEAAWGPLMWRLGYGLSSGVKPDEAGSLFYESVSGVPAR